MKILVLDDNEQDRKRLCNWIREWFARQTADFPYRLDGIEEHKFSAEASASLNAIGDQFGLAFISWDLKEINASQELLLRYRKLLPNLRFIVLSRQLNMSIVALKFGADELIGKPLDRKAVDLRLQGFLPSAPIQFLEEIKQEIVGESAALMETIKKISEAISNPKLSVLLTGETGTGKDLIAQTIHRLSNPGKQIVSVALGTYPSELVADAIFGHERGAFNEAKERRIGFLEEADGSSLFLDEIGELPFKVQTDLLRALETRRFHRLGAAREIPFDVRLICATNRDLRSAIETRQFREDLYYRINTLPIHVPPLRERREDIPLLLNHFLAKHSSGRTIAIDRVARLILEGHEFRGNVRELANIVAAAVAKCGDANEILPQHITGSLHLPAVLSSQLESIPSANSGIQFEDSEPPPDPTSPLADASANLGKAQISVEPDWLELTYYKAQEEVVRCFDAIYLGHQLKMNRYVIKKAAEAADIDRKTFTQRAERAGLLARSTANPLSDEPHEKEK